MRMGLEDGCFFHKLSTFKLRTFYVAMGDKSDRIFFAIRLKGNFVQPKTAHVI